MKIRRRFSIRRKSGLTRSLKLLFLASILFLLLMMFASSCAALDSFDLLLSGETAGDPDAEEGDSPEISADDIQPTPTIQLSRDLIVWMPPQFAPGDGSLDREMMGEQIQAFIDSHSQTAVDVRVKSETGDSSLINSLVLTAAAAPDALPTAILLPGSDLEKAVQNGLVRALDARELDGDWYPIAVDIAKLDSVLYGLPAAVDAVVMVKKAGSVDAGYVPMEYAVGLADSFAFPAGSANTLIPFILYQSGGGSFQDEFGEITLDEEILLDAFSRIDFFGRNRLFTEDLVNLNSEGDAWSEFASGNYESIFTWASRPLTDRESYSLLHFPGLGEEPYTYGKGWVWCLVEQDDLNEDLGLAFIDHMTEKEFMNAWTLESHYLPARSSSLTGMDQFSQEKIREILNSAVEIPLEDILKTLKGDIINNMQDLLLDEKSPQKALEDVTSGLTGENE